MKLSEAINMMELLRKNHGDVELYFDCPKCKESYTPNTCVTLAVHLTETLNERNSKTRST